MLAALVGERQQLLKAVACRSTSPPQGEADCGYAVERVEQVNGGVGERA